MALMHMHVGRVAERDECPACSTALPARCSPACSTTLHAAQSCLQHSHACSTTLPAAQSCLQHHHACSTALPALQPCLQHNPACSSSIASLRTYSFTMHSMLARVGLLSCAVFAVLRHTLSMYCMSEAWYGEWSTLCSLPCRSLSVPSSASCLRARSNEALHMLHTTVYHCNLVLQ